MKNSIKILAFALLVLTTSCNKDENIEQKVEQKNKLTPLQRAMSLLNLLEEKDPADATFNIIGESSLSNTRITQPAVNGTLMFTAGTNLNNVNIGDIMFNNILVKSSNNYNKFYDETELVQQKNDVDAIFGNNVAITNINCVGSALCNFNVNFNMIHKFTRANIIGIDDNSYITKNNGFTINWDNSNISVDEMIGIIIVDSNMNLKVGDDVASFSKLIPNTDSQIVINSSDLSIFPVNSVLTIKLIKGKSFTKTVNNNQKVRLIAADIMNFGGVLK